MKGKLLRRCNFASSNSRSSSRAFFHWRSRILLRNRRVRISGSNTGSSRGERSCGPINPGISGSSQNSSNGRFRGFIEIGRMDLAYFGLSTSASLTFCSKSMLYAT
uniref:Uncharacterized protein n=1 Tax=Ascaris lumbricoides TaxID=6252 RepID=A0A0M3IWW4_ASCLU